jgi:hypothetical protein
MLILSGVASVQSSYGGEKSELSQLSHHYVLDKVRVFYATDGVSAVQLADADSTGIPDHVEDVAKQVWAAKRLFCDVLGFPDPLTSQRYPGVTCIQVFLRERGEIGGTNGLAFDEPQRARRIPEGKPEDRAIVIAVGCNVVAPKNVTPAHELFHLIQYGATYFKKSWFLEGQARWAEHALAEGGLGDVKYSARGPWPQPPMSLPALFAMSADSEFVLWNPIAMGTDPKGLLPQTPELKELAKLRYSDGSPVLRDIYLTGADLMRDVLIELGRIDDVAFKELGYAEWSEANQRAPENDRYIYQAIMDALRRRSSIVGRFQVTKSATASPARPAIAPEDRIAKRADGKTHAPTRADSEVTKTVASDAGKWRTWTTRDGNHKVEAKFVKCLSGVLTLERRDGTAFDVRLDLLCADDQEFVTHRRWMKAGTTN